MSAVSQGNRCSLPCYPTLAALPEPVEHAIFAVDDTRVEAALHANCEAAARFSAMIAGLGDLPGEVDLNPVIVHADGCVIVDALVVPQPVHNRQSEPVRKAR